jgi:hypothetical protein
MLNYTQGKHTTYVTIDHTIVDIVEKKCDASKKAASFSLSKEK